MSDTLTLPPPKIQARSVDSEVLELAKSAGLHPLLARIIASRPKPQDLKLSQMLDPKLNCLDHPHLMRDMQKASERVAQAILNGEIIGIETDHDCDGQTSHAVLFYNLVHKFNHPKELIRSYIGHRLTEGYGLSGKVAQRILEDSPRASVIITADNGSTDEDRIALLKAQGIDVIVTDHHQLPLCGPPESAYACLNPSREDCDFPDPYIAGCMVAWLLMAATRLELVRLGHLSDAVTLKDTLDFVAVGTVADCVSMARSYNNRAIVNFGLKLINEGIKPCWRAIKPLARGNIGAEDLGFKIGPLLNSDGRLASAFGSVSFLLAEDDASAMRWVTYLQEQNQVRKSIQNRITQEGMLLAISQVNSGKFSLCIFLENGHAGVHGISASRIKECFGRPTVFLATKLNEEDLLTGSIRGIEGFNVGGALRGIMQQNPGILIAGGGHAAAGGITLRRENLDDFAKLFELAAQAQLEAPLLGPKIFTDGIIGADLLNPETLQILKSLEPFGREFDEPIFEITGQLAHFRTIGDGTHARVEIKLESNNISGVWFNFRGNFQPGDHIHCAFSLRENDFGGVKKCEIQIAWMSQIKSA